jgi:ribokinase
MPRGDSVKESLAMTCTIGILGNVNIDLLMGPLPKLPSWGRELIVPAMETRASGAAGYTIMALDRLGLPSFTVGAIGDDGWGDYIRRELAHYPLADLSETETATGIATGLSVALLDQEGQRGFVSYMGALARIDAELLARHEARLLTARYVLVCGYFFMPAMRGEPMRAFLRRARQAGVTVMLDTGWDLDDWPPATCAEVLSLLPDVDVFLPNLDEARALTGASDPEECASLLLGHGGRAVALKLGVDGSLWADSKGVIVQPGRRVTAVDTTGAGDSFNAALIYGLVHGWGMPRTLAFANAFCSVIVSRLRDRIPSVAETLAATSVKND